MRKILVPIAACLISLAVSAPGYAQVIDYDSYLGLRVPVPTGDSADFFDTGWGIAGGSHAQVSKLFDVVFEGTWHTLTGKSVEGAPLKTRDISVLGFQVGGSVNLAMFDLGVKGGYYFIDVSEWDLTPFAHVEVWRLWLGAEYKALGNVNWAAVYANFVF